MTNQAAAANRLVDRAQTGNPTPVQQDTLREVKEAEHLGRLFVPDTPSTRRQCNRLVKLKLLVRPIPNAYCTSATWQSANSLQMHLMLARTLAFKHPEWTFCSITAAALLGFQPPYKCVGLVQAIPNAQSHLHEVSYVTFHRLNAFETTDISGVKTTTPERTVFDCTRTLPIPEGLAIADMATRKMGWSQSHLYEYFKENYSTGRYHGFSRAIFISSLVNPLSESPGESITRANIMRCGFACPTLQVELKSPIGTNRYRVDFFWLPKDSTAVVGEYDGHEKYQGLTMLNGQNSIDAMMSERKRESNITALNLRILRISSNISNDLPSLERTLGGFAIPRVCSIPQISKRPKQARKQAISYLEESRGLQKDLSDWLNNQ